MSFGACANLSPAASRVASEATASRLTKQHTPQQRQQAAEHAPLAARPATTGARGCNHWGAGLQPEGRGACSHGSAAWEHVPVGEHRCE